MSSEVKIIISHNIDVWTWWVSLNGTLEGGNIDADYKTALVQAFGRASELFHDDEEEEK